MRRRKVQTNKGQTIYSGSDLLLTRHHELLSFKQDFFESALTFQEALAVADVNGTTDAVISPKQIEKS